MTLPRTPSFRLDGKRALVTGGTRGIGLGASVALAEAGAAVTIAARTAGDIEALVNQMADAGLSAEGVALDITDSDAVKAFVDDVEPFQVLVNSAGTARHSSFADITPTNYQAVMDLNLAATLFVSQAVVARLVAAGLPGSIIHISSQMGHVGGPARAVYAASKFAVEGLSKAMAIELGASNIRVNTVCPTFIETELTAKNLSDPEFRSWVLSKIKLGRLGRVEDIMGPIVFLASDAAALVTGASLLVDGGWTAE
ncbi:NAD(P)-dependent dehydrogenase, short-chain alcohol dehydrogenase family [Devosia sp. YR412]|uniref:SDR family NAD(P)-dependent oxidoreductase n=1 Tax=Devosia sp. YR412 TaxID=1881030 RepID=UPI0008BADF0A|nr:SDR family oxidoreductase [Devosia sp. YR412]SEP65046.1 NAD(P)-dependent dehydrogenase, short-chain alcohol dehydrogenase family [Devosia sp. YR412]